MSNNKRHRWFVLSGIALIYVVVIAYFLYKSVDSRTWVQVNAVVIKSTLISHDRRKEFFFLPTRYPFSYEPVLSYEYSVAGQRYQSQQVRIGGSPEYTDKNVAIQFISHHGSGRQVAAFYNPQNPAEATLKPGETDGVFFLLKLTLVLLCLSIFWNLLKMLRMLVGLPGYMWQFYQDIKSGKAFEIEDETAER
ncbi:MAG: DUF3592 domain-containing protein [Cyanobacteria bacterium]|nr:DUF3592 domain-containing protein [Cyanobacteriota bacterium]